MTLARRYIILQRLVWLQSAFCIVLSLYVLFTHKKSFPLNVSINESPAVDLSFLDMVTNSLPTARASLPAGTGAPVAPSEDNGARPSKNFPFRFDGYCVIDGVSYASVGNHVFRSGEYIHGQRIESISALGVVVDGTWYDYKSNSQGVQK